MKRSLTLALTVLLALVGCLEQTYRQTLYLEADGTVTWQVLVDHVPDEDPEKAHRHYLDSLDKLASGQDDLTAIMTQQGVLDIDVQLLRRTPPLRYQVTGRFASIDDVFEVLFEEAPVTWTVWEDEDGALLSFSSLPDRDEDGFHPLELVVIGGRIGDRDRIELTRFEDLAGLEIAWPRFP